MLLTAERILRRKTDVVLTMNSEDTRLAKKFRLAGEKITQINGMGAVIRRQITRPEAIRCEFFPKDAFILVFVGELSKRKNQKVLIEALKIIKEDVPEAWLCLVGEGGEKTRLKQLAESLGVANSVLFTGERRDACDFIRAADLYVSAAKSEGLPFNIIEALGAEKTVIASRVKGHADVIRDGVDGFLFDGENAASLADAVIGIYEKKRHLRPDKIREKYLRFEKSEVFPKSYSTIKRSLTPSN